MKRTLILLAGLGALAAVADLGKPLGAQQPTGGQPVPHPQVAPAVSQVPANQPHPLQTRIGLMNMVHVLKNYKKFQAIEENIRKRSMELEKSLEPFRTEVMQLKTQYNDPKVTQEARERIEFRMRQLQLDATQKEEEAKKELVKMNGDAAKMIYMEVSDAVNLYARSNNLELVLFYNDAITQEDYFNPANIRQKMTLPAAVMPIFVTPGMDISPYIVANLNARYQPSAPTASTGGTAPPH